MTRKDAIKHLENMKWLKGYSNTTVDGVPIGNVIDGIIALLKEQEPMVMTDTKLEAIRKAPLILKPNVDAVSVEWLRNLCNIADMETDDKMFIDWLIQTWQEEHKT